MSGGPGYAVDVEGMAAVEPQGKYLVYVGEHGMILSSRWLRELVFRAGYKMINLRLWSGREIFLLYKCQLFFGNVGFCAIR